MSERIASLSTMGVIFTAAAALIVRLYGILHGGTAANIVFYVLLAASVGIACVDGAVRKQFAPAFLFKNRFHLDVFSVMTAGGFFLEFVSACHVLYQSVQSGLWHRPTVFAPQCCIAVFSLMSGFYFCCVAMSFHSERYDFRALKLWHLAPLLWALSRMLTLMTEADELRGNPNAAMKYAALTASLVFAYLMAREVGREEGASRWTMMAAAVLPLLGEVYFFDSLMLLLAGKTALNAPDTVLAGTLFLISTFPFFFEKNIIYHTNTENS